MASFHLTLALALALALALTLTLTLTLALTLTLTIPQPPDLIGVTRTYERAVDEPVLRAVQALQKP